MESELLAQFEMGNMDPVFILLPSHRRCSALLLSPTTTPKSATSFNFPFFLPFSAVGDDRIAALLSVNKAAMTKQMMSHR